MEKYFNVNADGCSISCKLYANDPANVRRAILFGHGFAGHKDNGAAEKLARRVLSKSRDAALITFNWPCHGDDVRKTLRLEDCDRYLGLMISHIEAAFSAPELYGCATSFGGYLFLKYLSEHGNPFKKLALRCPAVCMYRVITNGIMTEDDIAALERGKPVLVGFDRKIRLDKQFVDSLREADISLRDLTEFMDDIIIIHGTEDEVAPFEDSRVFADNNLIELVPVEGADHRFHDPLKMDIAIKRITAFLGVGI